jgi:hypothetical protein
VVVRAHRSRTRHLAAALAATLAALSGAGPAAADDPPAGHRLTAREAIDLADRTEEVRSERRRWGRLSATAVTKGPERWQVGYFEGGKERAQVLVDDDTGEVVEAWTGPQVAWRMARGYEGAFGRKLNAPYVWIPLCLLFLLPFVDPRRPFRLIHLDLLVLLAFGASHHFFNRAEIGESVPLVYPVLAYLLVRLLVAGLRPRERRDRLVPFVPVAWLAVGIVFLVGFRVTLNVVDSSVIDVGYAGVIGADRIADGEELYDGGFAEDIDHGDTYGPAAYLAYIPFEQALPWSGSWDDLPAAHGAALAFDLLTLAALLVLGRRLRPGREGRTLGVALAFAWASYPYALYALQSNANDALVAMLLVWALVGLSSAPVRGALVGLAGAAKLGPFALVPLFAAAGGDGERRLWSLALFGAALGGVVLVTLSPFVPDGGLREVYDRTLGYQAGRESPFSVWGREPGLGWLHTVAKAGAVALAIGAAFAVRRRGPVEVAALAGAVLVAVQIAATHWFYLYVAWFAPLALVAFLAPYREVAAVARAAEPAPREEKPQLAEAAA